MDSHSPQTTCEMWLKAGVARHKAGPAKSFVKGIMGGVLLSFGGILSLDVGAFLAPNYLGLNRFIAAAVFPIGLIMIVLSGADLVTSNMAIFLMTSVKRKTPLWGYAANLFTVFWGNLVGSLIVAGLLGVSSGIFDAPATKAYVAAFATTKVVAPTFANILVRGIGCNILVCYAVFFGMSSREIISKFIIIWACIATFVLLTFDHVVANMLFIPLALMQGDVNFSVGYYIWKSLIPSFIGNQVGAMMMAGPLIYFYLFEDDELPTVMNVERSVPSSKKQMGEAKVSAASDSEDTV